MSIPEYEHPVEECDASPVNTLYAWSARDAKHRKQLELERRTLDEHEKFVEQGFDKADQYLKTIQLGGYAAFFAVWGFLREWIEPVWATRAACTDDRVCDNLHNMGDFEGVIAGLRSAAPRIHQCGWP